MAVRVGSAKGDEYGNATGGRAGDQTGGEVGTQAWYLHPKGWKGLRAKDRKTADKIADAMQKACDNDKIGYDQDQRLTLYNQAKKYGFDPSKVTTACETDCSALVRVCLAYAGISTPDFYTGNEYEVVYETGKFDKIPAEQLKSAVYARRGDILITKVTGHTVIVLNDGSKASDTTDSSASGGKLNRSVKWTGAITNCALLNVREWAGKENQTVSFSPLPAGAKVGICDEIKADDGSKWYYIKYNGRYGFIAARSSSNGKPYVI